MELSEFLTRLRVDKGPGGGGEYACKCPAHDDRTASLSVKEGEKGIVLHCHAGCGAESIVRAMGLTMRDLYREQGHDPGKQSGGTAKDARRAQKNGEAQGGSGASGGGGTSVGGGPSAGGGTSAGEGPKSHRGTEGTEGTEIRVSGGGPSAGGGASGGKNTRGRFVCAYPYVDETGKLLYESCRYEREDGGKSFLLRQPDPKIAGVFKYTVKGARLVLYRLPQTLAAVRAGQPVFVVEGEKDCDNMAALGYAATTNPMGAGKWGKGEYTESLRGADLYIIPDNDDAGRAHGRAVAKAALKAAKTVRILDLTKGCEALPAKGDVSDFYKLLGKKAGDEALKKLMREAEPYAGDSEARRDEAAEHYGRIPGYCVDEGRICQDTQDGPRPLANFVALPAAVVARDDGVNVTKEMVIDGWGVSGAALPRVVIKAGQFNAMNWVAEHWDFAANIMPGTATKDKIRYAISEVGRLTAERVTEYTHTGWRKIGGKWAYLYQGGAIGAEGVTVDLGSGLSAYRLDGSGAAGFEGISAADGAETTIALKACMADHVGIPLMGTIFLAPLREFLAATGIAPAYALFLLGGTGTRKSTALALALSHFGNFTGKSLPASFNDTANYIRKKAFLTKDAPIVVDDYHPVTSLIERKKMEATAQSLARAFGDGAERGRMRSDLSLQEAMPPRGVAIISGEDAPGVGESGMARFYIVNVGKDDIPATDGLTALQELARQGYLQRSMRGYIEWLLRQADEMPDTLHGMFLDFRAKALKLLGDTHGRPSEAIAHMMLGYDFMLRYMTDLDIITAESAYEMLEAAWKAAAESSRRQADEMREERPSKLFLAAISELLTSKAAGVKDLSARVADVIGGAGPSGGEGTKSHRGTEDTEGTETKFSGGGTSAGGGPSAGREMIGYMDAEYYYLLPGLSYRVVARMCNDQGQAFPISQKMLNKQMREDGVLTPENTTSVSSTRPKWVEGKCQRLLWVPRRFIDGPGVRQEQVKIDEF